LQDAIRLTPTSYIVLGLLAQVEQATPYELKAMSSSIQGLWTLQHAQLYSEPARLAAAGYLTETREQRGRRRRRYALAGPGREALEAWLRTPSDRFAELRDPGLLQLFFGGNPALIAGAQLELHRAKLAAYEEKLAAGGMTPGHTLALRAGIGHEHEWVRFWSSLADGGEAEPDAS
jgi:DNA-binding PadR family transcriptional regulator